MPMIFERFLENPSDAALAAAVEGNLFALFRSMFFLPGARFVEGGDLNYHLASPSNPMFKGVWGARLAPDEADAVIDETLAWFEERDAPFLFWWTGPDTTPDDLGERLLARGLTAVELDAPGMVADLHAMNDGALTAVPEGFAIEEVRDESTLDEFKRVLVAAFDAPEPLARGWVDATLALGFERAPWRLYLGRLAGEPVATNIVFEGAGVVGVYGIGTIPSARGKGIGGAITLKPLLEARDGGCRHAVLFSTREALGAYQRIGFRKAGVGIDRYLWRKA